MKLCWNNFKHSWNFYDTTMKFPWNTIKTTLKPLKTLKKTWNLIFIKKVTLKTLKLVIFWEKPWRNLEFSIKFVIENIWCKFFYFSGKPSKSDIMVFFIIRGATSYIRFLLHTFILKANLINFKSVKFCR